MVSLLKLFPAPEFTLVTAFSHYAQVYNFNALMIDVPQRPITQALRYDIHVNHQVITEALSFSTPNFVYDDLEPCRMNKDTVAKKLLSYHFYLSEETIRTYLSSFESENEPPSNPTAYKNPTVEACKKPYTRRWYMMICENFLAEKVCVWEFLVIYFLFSTLNFEFGGINARISDNFSFSIFSIFQVHHAITEAKLIPARLLSNAIKTLFAAGFRKFGTAEEIWACLQEYFSSYTDLFRSREKRKLINFAEKNTKDEWYSLLEAQGFSSDKADDADDDGDDDDDDEELDQGEALFLLLQRLSDSCDHFCFLFLG
jgi:hypothetical protein